MNKKIKGEDMTILRDIKGIEIKDPKTEFNFYLNKCGFCKKDNTDNISITDGETLTEVLICRKCDKNLNWDYYPLEVENIDDDKRRGI